MADQHGIAFRKDAEGRRGTSEAGRAVVAQALRDVDPTGALAVEQEASWRSGYVEHLRRAVEAGIASRDAWLSIARAGLAAVDEAMVVVGEDGEDRPATTVLAEEPAQELKTAEVRGEGSRAEQLAIPLRGEVLSGDALARQLDDWTARGVLEPSAAEQVREVMAHPEWLPLPGRTVAVLGAGSEMGPLGVLSSWGATVAAVDLPRQQVWERVLTTARAGAGTLLVPTREAGGDLAAEAGADLLAEVPAVRRWLAGLPGDLVLGNYLYADGATHVRVSTAADLVARGLQQEREVALAYLATPTDAFVVPGEAVDHATRGWDQRSRAARVVGRPLSWASRGRLLHRNYVPGADPGVCDALVPVQGPNYALAKRVQRWRAAVARAEGRTVSLHVAPSSRTTSVVKNRALAAAYAGAHRFGVEVFAPATANALMAALLVHDLSVPQPERAHPWQDEAAGAVHGGLWRSAYAPRSALGLSAVMGYTSR